MEPRSKRSADWAHIISACYEPHGDERWVANLLDALAPALDWGMGVGFSIVEEDVDQRRVPVAAGTKAMVSAFVRRSFEEVPRFDLQTYKAMYYPRGYVVRASSAFRKAEGAQRYLERTKRATQLDDAVGLLLYPRAGTVGLLTSFFQGATIPATLRPEALRQLRHHVESGLRLRVNRPSDAVAVLSPEGRVEHATGDARTKSALAALREGAHRIQHAHRSPESALRVWTALIDGRWTLAPVAQENGKVKYYVYENAAVARRAHALTEIERQVVRSVLVGTSWKAIGCELGIPASVLSRALAQAALKFGLRRSSELLRVAQWLMAAPALRKRGCRSRRAKCFGCSARGDRTQTSRGAAERRHTRFRTRCPPSCARPAPQVGAPSGRWRIRWSAPRYAGGR